MSDRSESTDDWLIEPIRKDHIRDGFDSGEASLDEFLRQFARQNEEKGLGRTVVATGPGDRIVRGYFTLRTGSIAFEDLPEEDRKGLPKYPIPVVHLGRLAVDRNEPGKGLGELLLGVALHRAIEVSQRVAVYAVEVVALNERARSFYEKYGFESLARDRLHMYQSIQRIRQAFG